MASDQNSREYDHRMSCSMSLNEEVLIARKHCLDVLLAMCCQMLLDCLRLVLKLSFEASTGATLGTKSRRQGRCNREGLDRPLQTTGILLSSHSQYIVFQHNYLRHCSVPGS